MQILSVLVAHGIRVDVGLVAAVDGAVSFLDRRTFLRICNLSFDLPKHDWESSEHVLVAKLLLVPEAALVVVESFLPLAGVGAARHVRSLRYHVEKRLALVADGRHVRLLFLKTVLMLLPPLTQLHVAELRYLGQLFQGLFRVFAGTRSDDVGWQLRLRHDGFIGFSFVRLENIFVSCSADHGFLARVSVFYFLFCGIVALGRRMDLDKFSLSAVLIRRDTTLASRPVVMQALLRTNVGYQI